MKQMKFDFNASTYRTEHFSAADLESLTTNAARQESRVLKLYADGKARSSSEVWKRIAVDGEPLTSIRRAITTLFKRGLLVKTDETVTGLYGRPEHKYRSK